MTIKLKVLPRFPISFTASSPILLTTTGGAYVVELDYDALHATLDGIYATIASPTFTGVPAAPTAAALTNTTQIATTAFVLANAATLSNVVPLMDGVAAAGVAAGASRYDHIHPTDTSRAALASPTFTGTPAAPTAALGTNTTQVATTAFVQAAKTAFKVVSFTRVMSLATGSQSVTGVGFTPRFIEFSTGIVGGSAFGSIGSSDGTTHNAAETSFAASSVYPQVGMAGIQRDAAAAYQSFTVSSMDSDGFTIAWTKSGSPTATATVLATCFR